MTDAAIIRGLRETCQWHERQTLKVEAENRRLIAENDALGNTVANLLCEIIELKEKWSFRLSPEEDARTKAEYLEFLESKRPKQ